jgi:hypothetical protein
VQLVTTLQEKNMAKPLGIVAMLTLLISGPALADNHIKKSDVDKVIFTKSNEIIFKMKDDSYYKGDIITPRSCNNRYQKIGFDNTIHNSYVVYHNSGFHTCKFTNLEKLA